VNSIQIVGKIVAPASAWPNMPEKITVVPYDAEWPESFRRLGGESGSWGEQFSLLFRDYLRVHSEDAAVYSELKYRLARENCTNRQAYTDAKRPFIWTSCELRPNGPRRRAGNRAYPTLSFCNGKLCEAAIASDQSPGLSESARTRLPQDGFEPAKKTLASTLKYLAPRHGFEPRS
jgi:hypothetical protein